MIELGGVGQAFSTTLAGYLLIGIIVCTSGSETRSSQVTPARIRADLDAGHYDLAEAHARELSRTAESTGGASEITDLLVEASWRNGRGDTDTLTLAERAVTEREGVAQATALTNLAQVLCLAGEYARAAAILQRSLAIRESATEPDHLGVANALDDLARALLLDARYDDARAAIDRAFQLREREGLADDIHLVATLELSAAWFQRRGEYSRARPLIDRALATRVRASPNHPALAGTLGLFGDQLWFEGAILDSANAYRQALTIAETTLRPGHPEIAVALQNLASVELARGAMAETLALRERALKIAEGNFGPKHPILAGYLNDLANGHIQQQDFAKAKAMYERALAIRERHLGSEHENVATIVFNLALLAGNLGEVADAKRQFARAARIWMRRLGAEHPFVATAWEGLAEILIKNRRAREALPVATRALSLRERSLGTDHVDVARSVLQLADIATQLGRPREAEALVARTVGIWERVNPGSPGHATALLQGAQAASASGHHVEAREMFQRAVDIRTRVYGPLHLDVARAQQGLANTLAHLGHGSLALSTALQAEAASRTTLRATVRYLPERQAIRFSDMPPAGFDVAASLVDTASDPARVSGVLDALILGRALVLDEIAARQRTAVSQQQPELASLSSQVAAARQRLANLAVRAPSDENPERYTTLLEASRRDKEAAERALAERSASFKQELERDEVGLEDVRRVLPANAALVSFVRYDRTIASRLTTVPHYAAFVLGADGTAPVLVQLGAASAIERALARWRSEAGTGVVRNASPAAAEAAYRTAGDRLRKLAWDSITPYLRNAARVFVVPDGALNLANLGSLPVGASEYVVEHGPTIHYLPTERDLAASANNPSTATGLFALGGPAFDDAATLARRSKGTLRRSACGTLQSIMFEDLPATLREATEVAQLWKSSGSGDAQLTTAAHATERAFKQQAPGRRVLHLATHGFFLGGDCASSAPGTRAVGRITTARTRPAPAVGAQNPLLVSGLAFAGANLRAKARPDEEDGILTAEEIAGMNLQGTEWAVLSACDTGLGEVKAGEGVFGLRRAFQIAGVRTVIMSLWSVEDEATRDWMRALYRARLNEGLDTAESVRAASLHVLRDRRARRLSTHPFHWGAFVSAGDWR